MKKYLNHKGESYKKQNIRQHLTIESHEAFIIIDIKIQTK